MHRQTTRSLAAAVLTTLALAGCVEEATGEFDSGEFDAAAYLEQVAEDLEAAETDEEQQAIGQAAEDRLAAEGVDQAGGDDGVYWCFQGWKDPFTDEVDYDGFEACVLDPVD